MNKVMIKKEVRGIGWPDCGTNVIIFKFSRMQITETVACV